MSPFGSSLDHFRELLEVTGVHFLPNLRAAGDHLDCWLSAALSIEIILRTGKLELNHDVLY